jgi:hypothetical protein
MKLIHIAIVVLLVLFSVPAEAHVVAKPCSHAIESEPQADLSHCALGLISAWQQCDEKSNSYVQHLFLNLKRGIALIGFVVCAGTEFAFDLLVSTLRNSR